MKIRITSILSIYVILTTIARAQIQEWEVFDPGLKTCFPWYSKSFIEVLRNWDLHQWHIFEWRSTKHSTVWLAQKCKAITAIEDIDSRIKIDNRNELMEKCIKKYHIKNLKFKKRTIELKQINHPVLGLVYLNPINQLGENSPYVKAIEEENILYDCIIIDGIHYNACAKAALNYIKPGGIIIINNCHRLTIGIDSSEIFELYKGYSHFSFLDPETIDKRTDYWIIN